MNKSSLFISLSVFHPHTHFHSFPLDKEPLHTHTHTRGLLYPAGCVIVCVCVKSVWEGVPLQKEAWWPWLHLSFISSTHLSECFVCIWVFALFLASVGVFLQLKCVRLSQQLVHQRKSVFCADGHYDTKHRTLWLTASECGSVMTMMMMMSSVRYDVAMETGWGY